MFLETELRLIGVITKSGRLSKNAKKILRKNPVLNDYILCNSPQHADSLKEQIFCIINNIKSQPICDSIKCTNTIKFNERLRKYSLCCSVSCIGFSKSVEQKRKTTCKNNYGVDVPLKSKKIRDKVKTTNLERYGVEHVLQSKEVKDKIKKTNLERYGVDNTFKSKKIRDKVKLTNLEKYGVDNPLKSTEIREKSKQTNLKRYGVEIPSQSKEVKEKSKQTNLERYGVDSYTMSDDFKEKSKQTNLERYGVYSYSMSDDFKEKSKQTNLERYGVEYVFQSKEVKDKIKKTNLDKYGVENVFQSEEIRAKVKQTNLDKYGVDNTFKSTEIKDKIKQINLERYGVDSYMMSDDFKEKSKQTNLERYGVYSYSQKHIPEDVLNKMENDKWLYIKHVLEKRNLLNISQILGISDTTVKRHLVIHDIPQFYYSYSNGEREVAQFLIDAGVYISRNDRTIIKPLELDIVIPDKKIAIEYCGLYWHSEFFKDKTYHFNKMKMCNEAGYRLITIFADEWIYRTNQVRSALLSKLGIDNRPRIYARKTDIIIPNKQQKKDFFDKYHIQGDANSSIEIGLLYQNEIVAIMLFTKNKTSYILTRYATKNRVVGGFSKILSHFKKIYTPKKIISFADRRWSEANMYLSTGWVIDSILAPDYKYVIGDKRLHKFGFRHKHLKNKLSVYDEKLTEHENMINAKKYRIYDCGLIRLKYGI